MPESTLHAIEAKGHVSLVSINNEPRLSPLRKSFSDDALWDHIRKEAETVLEHEPLLTTLVLTTILNCSSFEEAVGKRVAGRLGNSAVSADLLADAFARAVDANPDIAAALRADIIAVVERDPASSRLIEPFLYFKGFHAIETHRLAHALWLKGQTDLALYLQSRSSDVFQTDIHPAVPFGRGIFLDHATGFVVGGTATIDDNVSILQNVTLGGTGKETGDRHPKIRSGVMIGAGAKILGNIEIGSCARIAAGSVVLHAVPANTTVAGVPAKIVGTAGCAEPSRDMNQLLSQLAYESFSYSI
jgi:serine O-acetyltransferase